MWSKRVLLVLGLAAANVVAAQTGYVHNYCNMQGAKCITYSLKVIAVDGDRGGGDGDLNWDLDRVFLKLNADQCRVPIGSFGATTTVQGNEPLGERSITTPIDLTWRVPATCPYQLHMRHQVSFPFLKDDIYYDDIDAATAQSNYCLTWELYYDKKSTGCQ